MTLTLTIQGIDRLENGEAARIVFDRHGGVIGRSPLCDWCLPDTKCFISSRHCEVTYNAGQYVLTDISTNGTLLNGQADRMTGPHRLGSGDIITIGHYRVKADVVGASQAQGAPVADAASQSAQAWWGENHQSPQGPSASSWDEPQQPVVTAPDASDPWGPMNTDNTPVAAWPPPNVSKATDQTPGLYETDRPNTSAWQSAASEYVPAPAAAPMQADIWGNFAASNSVDWARGGFGGSAIAPVAPSTNFASLPATPQFAPHQPAPQGVAPPAATAQPAGWGPASAAPGPVASPPVSPTPTFTPQAPTIPPTPAGGEAGPAMRAFFTAVGLGPDDIKAPPEVVMASAGGLLRRLVSGLIVMLEARARAKAQMGAEATLFSFDGNNPLKFATSTENALAQLLAPPERGFMSADKAIEDGYKDLQAHQMATLAAMQSALRATLTRFSPSSIKARAEQRGFLAKIIPAAREATLWQAYEKEFSGVAEGSDEVFMEAFSKAFKTAYEEASRKMQ